MIRWYLVRYSDNLTVHDDMTLEPGSNCGSWRFPDKMDELVVCRLDASLTVHSQMVSRSLGFPISELVADRDEERTHLASGFSSLHAARRAVIDARLAEIGFNHNLTGDFTLKELLTRMLRTRFPRSHE